MQYTFKDLESWERQGMFLLVDKYDQDNKLPLSKCRVYGVAWWGKNWDGDGEGYTFLTTPPSDYTCYPFGRYLKEVLKDNLPSPHQD